MNDEDYQDAMQMILHAGNAKSSALMATEAASEGSFDEANEALAAAREELKAAHQVQFDLIRDQANGIEVEVNIILVHAQDHLTMATMAIDFAERFIDLYQKLEK